jgi:NADPH:quinone reductase-like Zn-dependent oxidoreductase
VTSATYAEQLVVPAADVAVVPDGLDLVAASTVPLNGLAASQIVDLLGDAPANGNRLLVTGAGGAVGGYVVSLAQDLRLAGDRSGQGHRRKLRTQPGRRLHHARREWLGRNSDGPRLGTLLARSASGELPARVHAVVPLDQVADVHRAMAKGGLRGRYVLKP